MKKRCFKWLQAKLWLQQHVLAALSPSSRGVQIWTISGLLLRALASLSVLLLLLRGKRGKASGRSEGAGSRGFSKTI